jgi:uncharacterized membrane-anchored protein
MLKHNLHQFNLDAYQQIEHACETCFADFKVIFRLERSRHNFNHGSLVTVLAVIATIVFLSLSMVSPVILNYIH